MSQPSILHGKPKQFPVGLKQVLLVGFMMWTSVFPAISGGETTPIGKHPAIQNPFWLKNAVQIRITPRGQKLFAEELPKLLSNLGVVISENYFPEFDYVSDQPIQIDELAKKQPEEFAMLLKVRQFFKQYLQGIQFKDFKPAVKIGKSEYIAEIARLSLATDEDLMQSLGKADGAVLSIEISLKSLVAQAESVDVKDLENPWFGQVGVQSPRIKLTAQDSNLITAKMPFYVRVDEKGILQFTALKVEENLDNAAIEVSYRKLILPQFEFKVAGQTESYKIKLNEDEFKKIVDDSMPDALKPIRKYVREFLQNDLPKLLNETAQSSLKKELEQIQALVAPNTVASDTRPPLSLGLKLSEINLVNSQWAIGLSAFIEDTSIHATTPFWKNSGARGAPNFNRTDPRRFDLAIAVDRAVFNRAIHLASNRNNFKKLETCPGQPTIELLSGPSIDFNPSATASDDLEAQISLLIDGLFDVPEDQQTKWGLPVLKDKIHLTMRYQAIIKPASLGSTTLNIYPTKVDLKTLQIDRNSLGAIGKLFEGKVRQEIEKILSEDNGCGNGQPMGSFELISSLWGIPLEYEKIEMDSQGQMMMYMNYKNEKPAQLK